MDGKKEYKIVINGITESINAVEALNKQLLALENRIKELDKSGSVNVKAKGTSNASALSDEERIQKEINKLKQEGATLDAKIVAAQDEVYKRVDATKQLYKETIADQKAMAAQERLTADAYSNTMQGMKQHLADLKSVINTTDMGDADKINQMTKDANELTNKLKEMEEAYGQFGRNVGNYQDAANGFKALAIQVGDATEKFDNAKQALKELKKERDTLAVKSELGIISEEEAKRLEDLIPTVAQLQSAIQDAGKPMDALMDSMQSFIAIMQSAKGISAFFGLDDDAVEESIKKLVALQNAMQGLQTIQKQLQSQEGIGKWLSKGNAAIDAFTKKLFGLDAATKTTNAALATTGTAGKTAAVGLGTASVAANTATKSFSLAAAAATALRVVLSALGIGLIIGAISALVEGISYLIDKQKEAKKFQEDLNNAIKDGEKEYAKTTVELSQLKNKLDNFNGSKKQEKKLVEELNSKYGTTIGQYKSVKEWKDALIKKGEAYAQVLKLEAENQALLNMYTENYIKLMHAQDLAAKGPDFWDEATEWLPWNWGGKSAQDKLDDTANEIEYAGNTILDKIEENNKKIAEINKENGLYDYAPQIEKNTTKTKNAMDEAQKTLNQLELRLMKEGLNKKLRQLDEEERQTINKLKENGRKTSAEIQKIQRAYAQLRAKEIQEYLKTIEDNIKQSADNIKKIQFEIDTKKIDNHIDALKNKMDELNTLDWNQDTLSPLVSKSDFDKEKPLHILDEDFRMRYNSTKVFYGDLINLLIDYTKDEKALNEERIREQEKQQKDAESERYSIQMSSLKKTQTDIKNGLKAIENEYKVSGLEEIETIKDTNKEIYEKYHDLFAKGVENDAQIETAKKQHKQKMQQITEAANNAIKKNELDTQKEISSTQEKYYNLQISNFRDLQSKINTEMQRQPVTDLIGFGIVNLSQSKKNYHEIENAAKVAIGKIINAKEDLDKSVKNGLISDEAASATQRELDDLEQSFKQANEVASMELKDLTGKFIDSIGQYINAVGQTIQGIMSAVWDYEDYEFDKQQDELDKWNDELDKALDKQESIISEHNNNINSIEDELATSRGDRRQHLIDQLNAEIAAQRAAEKEKQRIEKEQEKAQKRQDALDKKRKEAEYKRNLASILVSGAMAVTNAFATQPFVPVGIAMGALATTLTAVQYALAKQQKPYAKGGQIDGGVAQGKRHSEGGIPVLGGRASIEGGEFITNRQTTAKNVDLLEYINAKHRKLDIDDFIDFYSSGKVKKNITSMSPRVRYADGGLLTLNNDYNFDNRLIDAFERYAEKPTVVQVVDVINRMDSVRGVQVLAGLTPSF